MATVAAPYMPRQQRASLGHRAGSFELRRLPYLPGRGPGTFEAREPTLPAAASSLV